MADADGVEGDRREPSDHDESWPVVVREDLYRDAWVMALRRDLVTLPERGGESPEPFPRLVLEHPGAVIVLAVDGDERVLVVRQYRHAVGRRFVELPAGLRDVDAEDPVVTARRELLEETGYEATTWEHLLTSHPSPGISTERMEFFLATGLRHAGRGEFEAEHEEAEMSVEWVPLDDLVAAVLESRVTDGPLGLAVLAYLVGRRAVTA